MCTRTIAIRDINVYWKYIEDFFFSLVFNKALAFSSTFLFWSREGRIKVKNSQE